MTFLFWEMKNFIVSDIILRFSAEVVFRILRTMNTEAFPTTETYSVPASSAAVTDASESGLCPTLQQAVKAQIFARNERF
ncbi:hypothetical protein SDC9_63305 [bioreactor metagenome]|uniref:Uncharacterized protein n=1 Tax=bioreactor metagenome TaxID=1076179 RepID=A0A644XRN9_9ZZZZ